LLVDSFINFGVISYGQNTDTMKVNYTFQAINLIYILKIQLQNLNNNEKPS